MNINPRAYAPSKRAALTNFTPLLTTCQIRLRNSLLQSSPLRRNYSSQFIGLVDKNTRNNKPTTIESEEYKTSYREERCFNLSAY